jgi:hypothetical protein
MFARLSAKAIVLAAAMALVFFGIGLLGLALAAFLSAHFGAAGGDAIAGAVLLVPVLLWGVFKMLSRPAKPVAPQNNGTREVINALFAAVAKETPWIAIVGAGLAGAADMFLNRNKPKK